VLPGIAAAVGDQVEIVLDGGIRRGGRELDNRALVSSSLSSQYPTYLNGTTTSASQVSQVKLTAHIT
jgi:hypothetical protein